MEKKSAHCSYDQAFQLKILGLRQVQKSMWIRVNNHTVRSVCEKVVEYNIAMRILSETKNMPNVSVTIYAALDIVEVLEMLPCRLESNSDQKSFLLLSKVDNNYYCGYYLANQEGFASPSSTASIVHEWGKTAAEACVQCLISAIGKGYLNIAEVNKNTTIVVE